ncbi:amidohydrolase family protein [Chloroflexota bacterium]
MPIDEAWQKLTLEDPIEPELPICDPHHHLWDHPNNRYLLDEVLQDMGGGHHIVQTVFIECKSMYRKDAPKEMQPVGETEFVQGISAQSASGQYGATAIATGMVGFVDFTIGKAVEPVIEAHLATGKRIFRGIRYMTTWDATPKIAASVIPPKLLMNSKFREGFACLKKYGLSFDSWLFFHQLMELVDLARTYPYIPIILNHIGGPVHIGPYAGKRDEVLKEWKHGITELATCPNVSIKLGGLGMPRCGFGWHERSTPPTSVELAEAMSPYYLECIEKFGVNRCMFESNFPVDKLSYSYTVIWNAFKRITKDFSPDERAALFYDNAIRIYRLP